MAFETVILLIMKALHRQRTISAPYHILKGKKSGQTIQDIGYFKLHPFFSLLPQLDKSAYDQAVRSLKTKGLLRAEDNVIILSDQALSAAAEPILINGWKYRGRERLFFARLSLIVQTLSFYHQGIRQFDPVQTADDIQWWVKRYLSSISFKEETSYKAFKQEMKKSLAGIAVPDEQKGILLQRLSGNRSSGKTWHQIAAEAGGTEEDAKLAAVETLHAWLTEIESGDYPLLSGLLEGVVSQSALTDSTKRTLQLFKEGYSIDEIAAIRKLKRSTIEDHFVEMAMNDPAFEITKFMTKEEYDRIWTVSQSRNTKRLRDIKERFPEMSYFQIRLALSAQGGET